MTAGAFAQARSRYDQMGGNSLIPVDLPDFVCEVSNVGSGNTQHAAATNCQHFCTLDCAAMIFDRHFRGSMVGPMPASYDMPCAYAQDGTALQSDLALEIGHRFPHAVIRTKRSSCAWWRQQRMRVAIYARVSTKDRGQDPENQLAQLRAWCAAVDHQIIEEYVDHASGGKGAGKRPRFAAMLDAAHRRQFDLLLVWALDRLSREGMVPTINHLQRLAATGVTFHSYTEPLLSTDNELIRDIVLAIMASLAKMERQKISERTKAGLERAKAKGKRLGRAPFSAASREKLRMVLDAGMSWHAASAATRIPYSTVRKHARLMGYEPRLLRSPPTGEAENPRG